MDMENINENGSSGQGKVTAAKRIIAHMNKDEVNAMEQYVRERQKALYKRERDSKIAARWEALKRLPPGTQLKIWTTTYNGSFLQRGDCLEIDSFSARGRRCVYLKLLKNGKCYSFNPEEIETYDFRPASDGDPTGITKGILAF
jgi:hypothetical protein